MMPTRQSRLSSNSDSQSVASNEGNNASPTYILEHLATFSVSPENDLIYPADGMRRLLAMEKTNGIWTQRMMMRFEHKLVNIIDYENKEIVEQFPSQLVREPTAFTSNDPKEMYNNILIFIVGHPPGESPIPPEMHIFQCVNVRARDVVEDLKDFMSGRGGKSGNGRDMRRRFPADDEELQVGDVVDAFDTQNMGHPAGGQRMQAQLHSSAGGGGDGDASSTSSDKYEKEVTILNRCFDDIEKFIARLQHAAAAFRELEKRRRSRKSKKKDLGDGMLSMRAKPPPEREFVDIFQKFKLSFNLLAKLKAHIHDPNAPELVHFLFTPLALIVDASHDSHYGPNLPAKVVAPLLSSGAIELLINCLTSKESELWHSLGEAWYVPSEEWKSYVPPYRPVFMDGWSPAYVIKGENEMPPGGGGQNYPLTDSDAEPSNLVSPPPPLPRGMHRRTSQNRDYSDASGDDSVPQRVHHLSPFEREQRGFMEELLNRGCRVVQVTYPRTGNNEKELTVTRGEFLEVLDSSRKWWKTRNIQGQVGHVPHTIVTEAFSKAPRRPKAENRFF